MTIANLPAIRARRPAWNKGRVVGQKRPLLPKHVWAIRVRLEIAENHRDLALFNLAIDSKLRGCALVTLQIADNYASGQVKARASPSGWVVHAKPPVGGPEAVLSYLSRYTHRVVISNHRDRRLTEDRSLARLRLTETDLLTPKVWLSGLD